MKLSNLNEKGAIPVLILVAVIGLVVFIFLTNLVGFKDKFFAGLFPKPASHASTSNVDLAFMPSQITVNKDQEFTVDIVMDAKTEQVTSAQINFSYDPQKITPVSSSIGTAMKLVLPPGTSNSPASMTNGSGVLALGINPTDTPVSGNTVIATLRFKAVEAANTTSIAFTSAEVAAIGRCATERDANGQLPCENMAGDLTPAQVTINNVAQDPTDTAHFTLQSGYPTIIEAQQEFPITVKVDSTVDAANLFSAKFNFNSQVMQVVRIETDENTFVTEQNWVEKTYDNSLGKISIIGGVPNPGFLTPPGGTVAYAKIWFKGIVPGNGTLTLDSASAIYRNSDNVDILQQNNVTANINFVMPTQPGPSATPTSSPSAAPSSSPTADSCVVTQAIWKNTANPVDAGTTVPIEVTGNSFCAGKTISFTVLEDDGALGTDQVTTNPVNATFSTNNVATSAWIAEYQPDGFGGISDPPEYVFSMIVDGQTFTSHGMHGPKLEVSKPTGTVVKQGDINKDGKVDLQDLSVMMSNWNKNTNLIDEIDQNDDGVINTFDFGLMLITLRAEGVLSAAQ